MQQDNLYQKSVTAVFLLMVFGISLFFYSAYRAEQKQSAIIEEINQRNLTALLENSEAVKFEKPKPEDLEGINNLLKESAPLDTDIDPSQTQSSQELENLLKNFR